MAWRSWMSIRVCEYGVGILVWLFHRGCMSTSEIQPEAHSGSRVYGSSVGSPYIMTGSVIQINRSLSAFWLFKGTGFVLFPVPSLQKEPYFLIRRAQSNFDLDEYTSQRNKVNIPRSVNLCQRYLFIHLNRLIFHAEAFLGKKGISEVTRAYACFEEG